MCAGNILPRDPLGIRSMERRKGGNGPLPSLPPLPPSPPFSLNVRSSQGRHISEFFMIPIQSLYRPLDLRILFSDFICIIVRRMGVLKCCKRMHLHASSSEFSEKRKE